MAQRTDLYSILMSYADKRHSPSIDIDPFILFLEKHAIRYAPERPEWKKWTTDAAVKFYGELQPLLETGKCEILGDNQKVLMTDFYADIIGPIYQDMDNKADIPFPDEKTLGIALPEGQCRIINIGEDLSDYLENPQTTVMPVIKIVFPENIPSALTLANTIPRPLLDAALLKLRNFLRTQNNKDFFLRRVMPQMQGKENLLKDAMNMLEIRPLDCILHIETAAEFTNLFWAIFSSTVKTEQRKKKEYLSIDIAALQSIYIIEAFVGWFYETTSKKRERELALKALENKLNQPPCIYTLDSIIKFTDNNGHALLGQYSQEDLQAYLKTKTTESKPQELPELLVFKNRMGEQIFINKQKVIPTCLRLLGDARTQVRKAVGNRWARLLREYRKEPSMEKDEEFERLLFRYTAQLVPTLINLLEDKKVFLVHGEIERSQGTVPLTSRFYTPEGTLLPMATLLMIKRKDILTDTRILLPIWYSIPILSSIIAFFKRLGSGGAGKTAAEEDAADENAPAADGKYRSAEQALRAAAEQIKEKQVPSDHSLDSYMAELEKGWQTLVNKEAKKQLIADIKSLIKDRLRRTLRIMSTRKISVKTIEDLAGSIYKEAPALQKLGDETSITIYIKVYITKLLLTIKM